MFEKIVEKILSPIISQYIEDFNAENMKIGLWSGEVVIKNVKLRKEIIKKLNLPLKLNYSRLGSLKMSIPWKNLGSSKIEIQIDGLELIITQLPKNMWECKNTKIIEKRKQELMSFSDSIIQDFAKKAAASGKDDQEKGFFGGMITKIIDNVQVTIKNIHIRYEDEITKKYSFGITLDELKIYTVNKQGEPEFIDRSKKQLQDEPLRKKLLLSNFGIYWNERSEFFNDPDPHNDMLSSIARIGQPTKLNYLILMSFQAQLYQRQAGKQYVEPEINLVIEFEEMKIKISNEQLQQIVTTAQRLQSFINEVRINNRIKLTRQQMIQNAKQFERIYPSFLHKNISPEDLTKLENILQKMEVENFQSIMKVYLQTKQKQKLIQEKLNKKKGWFSFSAPKQLTEEEMKEIESFMKQNFGTETKIIKRPQDFYYIKVNFKLNLLSLAIANTNLSLKTEEGLNLNLSQIGVSFGLRENGYLMDFIMDNMRVDMYNKKIDSNQYNSLVNIIQKVPKQKVTRTVQQYAKLKVVGKPLDKEHIDTQIILATEQLFIQFDPRILKVAQDFANIKVSSQNTDAAIQAYGDIKNKVSTAASDAATSITSSQKKKNFISLDVAISCVNIILFFDPSKTNSDIWVINLGQTKIFSDAETLKKPEFAQDEAMQKYCLNTSKMSMIHFVNKQAFLYSKAHQVQININQKVLSDLNVDVEVEMFKKSTEKIPKIRARTALHNLDLNISNSTYPALQKIGNCFAVPQKQEKSKIIQIQKKKENEKSQVMKESKKIGIIYQQTKEPKKFIAVLSGSYLYLYADKKDLQYTTYYYVKNSKITTEKQEDVSKKVLSLVVQNSVNKFKLGFDKEQPLQEWKKAIASVSQQVDGFLLAQPIGEEAKQASSPKKVQNVNPNNLNFQVFATLQKITINALLQEDKKVTIGIVSLAAVARLHEAKIVAKISLKQLKISDNIYNYKYKQLQHFLYSTAIEGKQRLIDIDFQMLTQKHPDYKYVDANIAVQIGGLVCNYKPEAVENLMLFFLPKSQSKQPTTPIQSSNTLSKKESQDENHELELKRRKQQQIRQEIKQGKTERFAIKLSLGVEQIAVTLVNHKSKTMFAKIGLNGFKLQFGQSSRRMALEGGISELWLADYSNYPNTIIQEQDNYTKFQYIVSLYSRSRDMVGFNVQLLQLSNQSGKKLLVNSVLYDLKVSYTQQPVLRMITYLIEQMLPSLTPSGDSSKPKLPPINYNKPENPGMDIVIDLQNILTVIQPRDQEKEYLELLVKNVSVRNASYLRPFIKDPKSQDEKVLVENYIIKVSGISIIEKFKQKQVKLTNDMSIDLSCDLVQNSPYYDKTYGERYIAGMRVDCKISPFLMRINHEDYNFMMKCLFWNISYDDNAEGYFYDGIFEQQRRIQNKEQTPEPMYINVSMESIILCITENELPLSVLLLGNLGLNLFMKEGDMKMTFVMKNMYGTNITTQGDESIEKGMFNLFGFERKLNTKELYDAQNLIKIYSVDAINKRLESNSEKPVITLDLETGKSGNMNIYMKIQGLKIAIQLKSLLIFSKLALVEGNIQPPKSIIPPKLIKKVEPPPANAGRMIINLEMSEFLGCLSDNTGKNYVVMEGAFFVKLKMEAAKPQQEVLTQVKSLQKQGKALDVAHHIIQVRDFSFYFCNVNELKNKRYLLLPMSLGLVFQQAYGLAEDVVFLESDIEGQMEKIIIQCSVRDMLMINKILQDNLKTLSQNIVEKKPDNNQKMVENKEEENKQSRISVRTQISELQKQEEGIDKQTIQKTVKEVEKKIKNKMKANVTLQPMQVRIVNDCSNNFMPVLNFITQQTNIMGNSDPIKTRLALSLTMNLDFFNPRSANWEPIIETFQITVDFLSLVSQFGNKTQIILSSSEIEELKQFKLNLSTQLVSSLLATIQIAKSEHKKIESVVSVNEIEVSPYIIENKTDAKIQIERFGTTVELKPLFKGPIKLEDKASELRFIYRGRKFAVSLQKYGQINVPGLDDIHLDFKMDKLNRILCFVNSLVIKNATYSKLYCIRYNEKKEPIEENILMEPGDIISIEKEWYVKFSFNSKSFTTLVKGKALLQTNILKAESEKFRLSVTQKRMIMGHSTIMIRTPFVILNCLPKDIEIQFFSNGKQVSSKSIISQGFHEVFANDDVYNMSFKLSCEGFYWSYPFSVQSQNFGQQNQLYLQDRQRQRDGSTIKYIFQNDQKRHQFRLNIFCPAFILSELDYDVQIYSNLEKDEKNEAIQKYYKLGGQSQFWKKENQTEEKKKIDKITIIGSESGSKIRVCGNNCLIDFSEPVSIKNIGVSQARIVVEKEVYGKIVSLFTVLGVEVSLKKMAQHADIFSRQITLRSRWIFFNNSEHRLMVKQHGGDKFYFDIEKGEKKPFYFIVPDIKEKPKALIFKAQKTNESVPILANGLGSIFFRLASLQQPGKYFYFKLVIQQIQSYLYYEIAEVTYEKLPYQLVVKSQQLQAYVPLLQRQVRKDSPPCLFINQIPHVPYNIQLLIRPIGSTNHKQIIVQADNLKFKQKMQFYEEGITEFFIPVVVYVIFSDSRKYIVIDELHKEKEQIPEYETSTINFKLEKLSLSIIQNHTQIEKPFESFYFYMSNLEFIMDQTNKRTKYQAKLQFMQLDQDQPYNIPQPVIITPSKYKQFTSTDPKDKPKSIFNALVEIDNSFVKNLFINQMVLDINDIVVHVGSPFIKLIMQIAKDYTEAAKTENEYFIQKKINTWKDIQLAAEGSKTFIKSIRIAPFTVDISAQIRLNQLDTETVVIFGTILNALGVVITNIEDAPIIFDGIALEDCVDSLQGINNKLIQHYKGSVLKQLYKIFGSLNIIGNPVSLFRNISTGFKDLKDKPSEGFVEGPLQFGKGLAEGTSSLIAHTVGGALNSVEKFTGTVSTGLAALTFDKQFEEMREKQKMKKPKHVFEGIQKGGKAVFHGFKEGITGLFLKPIQNTKKQGAIGFIKGTGQGLAGLIVKPVTGIIDFASKTTEGLKNTALYLEDKPNQNRIRYPRVLYTETGMVREYDPIDSKLFAIINKTKYEQKYGITNTYFLQSYKVGSKTFLVVLKQNVVLVHIEDQKIEWNIPLNNLKLQRNQQNVVTVQGPPKNQQFWEKSINEPISFESKEEADKFQKLIEDLKANAGTY